ncbi:MAG: hypothetical protein WCS43_14980 [Verrucomicrobiota bacterium]
MKTPIPIYLAIEDDLSEWMLRRLLSERPVPYAVGHVFKQGGFGYLKKQSPAFNNLAKACPVLLLTDLDQRPCAPELLDEWLKHPRHPDFLLRVAVREVEAWLLACDSELSGFLGIRRDVHFPSPEVLPDPKAELLKLAADSPRRELREAIVRRDTGGNLRQGPAYNSTLAQFVNQKWQSETASAKCPSLGRMLSALSALETDWPQRKS